MILRLISSTSPLSYASLRLLSGILGLFIVLMCTIGAYLYHPLLGNIFGIPEDNTYLIIFFIFVMSTVLVRELINIVDDALSAKKIEDVLAHTIVPAVKENIPDALDVISEYDSKFLKQEHMSLKRLLYYHVLQRHTQRVAAIRKNAWIRIYDFSVIFEVLLPYLFSTSNDSESVLKDYTVAYNADVILRNYSFENYYKDLLKKRKSQLFCETRIQILILVDFDENQKTQIASALGADKPPVDAGIHFENCLKGLLEYYKNYYKIESDELRDIYQHAVSDKHGDFSIRLITKGETIFSDAEANEVAEQPFNIYDNLAVSRSIIRAYKDDVKRPVPHVSIAVHSRIIEKYRKIFDRMWDDAERSSSKKFAPNEGIQDLGSRKILARWIVESDKLLDI